MKGHVMSPALLAAVLAIFLGKSGSAQSTQSSDAIQGTVLLTKLFPPSYPPLAKQARIAGDVMVAVRVRPDGSVESASAVSGHAMLGPAAAQSATKSEFECHGCQEVTPYSLVYTFAHASKELLEKQPAGQVWPDEVAQSENHVTITSFSPPMIIDDYFPVPVRSAKCLFLWKCGARSELVATVKIGGV